MPYNYPVLLPLADELFRVHRLKPTSEWRAQFAMYLSAMPPYYAGPLKRALLRMGAGSIAQSIPEENYLSYSVLNYLNKLKAQAKTEYDRTCNEVALRVKTTETKRIVTSFKNPFDIPRHLLLDQIARLRTLFLRPSQTSALLHGKLAFVCDCLDQDLGLPGSEILFILLIFKYFPV
jgi:integrator complex subunit 6